MEDIMKPQQERKPYEAPAIILETTLEVRAGSPIGLIEKLKKQVLPDPAGLYKK